MQDTLGDRIKTYERRETDRAFLPFLPVYARIDGRSFSKFTKGLDRPFDQRMAQAMQNTTAKLISATGAKIGYTQSDEISLLWETTEPNEEMFFAGKVQKLCSVLAGMTSSFFLLECLEQGGLLEEKARKSAPHFDARVFQLPNRTEGVNALIWREKDAIKNAISMAAHHHFSHKSLQGLSGGQKLAKLAQAGVNFDDYPEHFRRGVFLRNITREMPMPDDIRKKIPPHKQPPEGATITRSAVMPLDLPILVKVVNRNEAVFDAAEPHVLVE